MDRELTDELGGDLAAVPEAAIPLGRRALLGRSFALAASGLLLPRDVIDAATKRDKRQRRRDRRDKRQDRRDDPPPGRGLLRDVWFEVHNDSGGSLQATRWVFVQLSGWQRQEDLTLPTDRPWYVYTQDSTWLALQVYRNRHLTSNRVVIGENILFGPETISIAQGQFSAAGCQCIFGVQDRAMSVGERVEAQHTAVERLPNDTDSIRFRVTLRAD